MTGTVIPCLPGKRQDFEVAITRPGPGSFDWFCRWTLECGAETELMNWNSIGRPCPRYHSQRVFPVGGSLKRVVCEATGRRVQGNSLDVYDYLSSANVQSLSVGSLLFVFIVAFETTNKSALNMVHHFAQFTRPVSSDKMQLLTRVPRSGSRIICAHPTKQTPSTAAPQPNPFTKILILTSRSTSPLLTARPVNRRPASRQTHTTTANRPGPEHRSVPAHLSAQRPNPPS